MTDSNKPKARRKITDEGAVIVVRRQTQAALGALPAMTNIKKWLDLDTAGKRYDPLKADAKHVMEALEKIGIDGQAYLPNPLEGGAAI